MTPTSPRTWLITGASRGLGRAFAEAALEAGDAVVATARRPEQLHRLERRRMTRATPIEAYDEILGARRKAMSGALARTQAGGPQKAAQALRTVLGSETPPRRLLLGVLAADVAPATYRQRLAEWAAWDEVARSADFDSTP